MNNIINLNNKFNEIIKSIISKIHQTIVAAKVDTSADGSMIKVAARGAKVGGVK